jgi:hypothetical protein
MRPRRSRLVKPQLRKRLNPRNCLFPAGQGCRDVRARGSFRRSLGACGMVAIAGDFSFFGSGILALLAAILFSGGRYTDARQVCTFVLLGTLAHSRSPGGTLESPRIDLNTIKTVPRVRNSPSDQPHPSLNHLSPDCGECICSDGAGRPWIPKSTIPRVSLSSNS